MNHAAHIQTLESRRLLAAIVGAVLEDFDGDGQIDAGEQPISGVQVFIDANANDILDPNELTTTTTRDGYQFSVQPGTYRVAQVTRPNSLRTFPAPGRLLVTGSAGWSSSIFEIDRQSGQITRQVSSLSFSTDASLRGQYLYTYAPGAGGTAYINRQHIVTGEGSTLTSTPLNEQISDSVLLGDEMYLRHQFSQSISVVSLSTGAVLRTLTLPAGAGFSIAAMTEHRSLLVATSSELLWIDPVSGAVTRTVARSGPATGLTPRVSYLDGVAFLQASANQFFRCDVFSGVTAPATNIEGNGYILSSESSSHVVTLSSESQFATALFQQGEYSKPAQPPVILSTTNGFRRDSTIRVAINGTTEGARLLLYHPTVSNRDRGLFSTTASAGTTIVEFKGSDILRSEPLAPVSIHGITVLQTEPFKLVQPYGATTRLNYSNDPFNFRRQPPAQTNGWTNNPRPEFAVVPNGSAISNADIELYADGRRVASAPYVNNTVVLRPDSPLQDGAHGFSALVRLRQTLPGPVSAWQDTSPLAISLEIDQAAPTATMSYAFDAATPMFQLVFSEPVVNVTNLANDLVVSRLSVEGEVIEVLPPSAFNLTSADGRVFAISPVASAIADGVYRLGLSANAFTTVRDRAGNLLMPVAATDVFVLAGDVNRDRTVNFADLLILAQNFGQADKTFSQGNIDYSPDGAVNFDDLLLLAQRYGQSLISTSSTPANERKKRMRAASLE